MMDQKKNFLLKSTSLLMTALLLTILNFQTMQPQVFQGANLDPNWATSPGYAFLHDGKILGRDFIFTFGPLHQVISILGAKLHNFLSSVFSLHLIELIATQITIILLLISLLLMKFIKWQESVLVLLISNSIVELRFSLLITCITLLVTAFTKISRKHRFLLGGLAGCFAFFAQIYVFDMGVYSIFLIIGLCLLFSLLSWLKNKYKYFLTHEYLHVQEYFFICLIAIIVFLILNFVLSVAFLYTSDSYLELFQYQKLSMSILKGYIYQMGKPVHPAYSRQFLLFLFTWIFLVIITITSYQKMKIQEAYYHIAYLALATILIKNTLVRTDFGHLVIGFQGIMFFLPIAVSRYSEYNSSKIRALFVWSILCLVMLSNGVFRNSFFSKDLVDLVKHPMPFQNFENARNFLPETNEIYRYYYQLPLQFQDEEKIVILGVRNYIAEFYDMEIISPTLQDYTIFSPPLEDFVMNSIEKNNYPIILFDYGLLLDDIYNGSRYPGLFQFLVESYHMPSMDNLNLQSQTLVLERKITQTNLELIPLSFSENETKNGELIIQFDNEVNCKLLKVGLIMNYPPFASVIGTPGKLEANYSLEGKELLDTQYAIGALDIGEPFFVFLPTISTQNVWQIFYSGDGEVPTLDQISFGIWGDWTKDPTYIIPTFSINSVSCVCSTP